MISILIPTYNYNVFPLVQELHKQATGAAIPFEIRVYDDCSSQPSEENEQLKALPQTHFIKLAKNIGRSAIRNKLASEAVFDILLFLDADTRIINKDFLQKYLESVTPHTQILYGGIVYQDHPPTKSELLRWKYGIKREALPVEERLKAPHLRFLTLNFIIRKEVFSNLKFNEKIPNLRHEDTLFALDAQKKEIRVDHIDNPVMHLGLESSAVFLRKSEEAVEALQLFVKQGLIKASDTALSKKATDLKESGRVTPHIWFFKCFKGLMRKNLLSGRPSLFIFDIYRLGYYLQIDIR